MSDLAPAPSPVPVRVDYDPLARFRRRIAQNAQGWLGFLTDLPLPQRPNEAHREFANLYKATEQALAEPSAWAAGLDLAVVLGPAVTVRGHWLEWAALLDRAISAARRLDQWESQAHLLDQRGNLARFLEGAPQALVYQTEALALFQRAEDAQGMGRTLNHLSQAHMTLGDHSAAQACCREAATLLAATDDRAELAQTHLRWGMICTELGQWDEALAQQRAAGEIYGGLGDVGGRAKALNNRGEILRRQADYPGAIAAFEQAIAMHSAAGDEINAARSRVNLGIVYNYALNDPAQALALHREAEPLFRRLGDRPWLARVLNNQGVFLRELGQPGEAARVLGQAAALYLQNGNPAYAASTLITLAKLRVDLGQRAPARAALDEAEALLRGLAHPPVGEWARWEAVREVVGGAGRRSWGR